MSDTPHHPIQAAGLPEPAGPYSPGIVFDRLVLVSGQGATDPGLRVEIDAISYRE